jgi:hypothetical protein
VQIIDAYNATGEIDIDPQLSMEKPWVVLRKFEQNFNHYMKARLLIHTLRPVSDFFSLP